MHPIDDERPWTFYAFAAFFGLFVLFLYGPMIVIYILSFQGPNGGMTFPLNGVSLHWFDALISQTRVGDIAGSFVRSISLAAIVAVVTVVLSVLAGLGFREVGAARRTLQVGGAWVDSIYLEATLRDPTAPTP